MDEALMPENTVDSYYKAYEEYAKALRTWLVAYGIGGPVLFLTNETSRDALKNSGKLRDIAACFLIGVALQIIVTAINKSALWAVYFGEESPGFKETKRYKLACWVAKQYCIDLVCDIASMLLFALSTYWVFIILAS
jgi:hypothetical protein